MRTTAEWDRLADSLEYPHEAAPAVQEQYVAAFDLDPAATLDVGWHLFGDRPERGQFLAMLRSDLCRVGVLERGDLPDYLPTLLRLIAREDAEAAAALAVLIAPAVERMRDRLHAQNSPLSAAIDAVALALEGCRPQEEKP